MPAIEIDRLVIDLLLQRSSKCSISVQVSKSCSTVQGRPKLIAQKTIAQFLSSKILELQGENLSLRLNLVQIKSDSIWVLTIFDNLILVHM